MSGNNYDYPPASSRRPSRPSGPDPSAAESFPQRVQRIIDGLTEQNDEPDQNARHGEFRTSLHQIFDDIAPDIIAQSINEGLETPRESSHSTTRPSRERLVYLRNLIHSESNHLNPEDTSRALAALNQEIEEHQLDQVRELAHFEQARATVEQQLQHLGAEVTNPTRRRTFARGFLDRHRSERPPSTLSPASSTQEPRSTNRSTRRRAFRPDFSGISGLAETIPTPSFMPQPAQSHREGRERLKRRKLDTDDHREGLRGFNYGHYGQVVPGALKMEIASCDGGIYDPDGDCSFPENILRNDNSVYCTKSDRCNLVLRHQSEAPFCLQKLIIKAPRNGYDSPIQEGMIFVTMTSEELARTAQYQIQYSSSGRRHNRRRMLALPSQEYLNSYRAPLQSLERTVLRGPDSLATTDNETTDPNTADPQAEFRISTDYNENTEDSIFYNQEDEGPSAADLERMQEEEGLFSDSDETPSEDEEEEEEEEDIETNILNRRHRELQRRIGSIRRGWPNPETRRQGQPSLVDPIPPPPNGSGGASGSEVLKPHARFFIEREKSMVSIKFDPPPSGRFILIKLWSPRNSGNIDIQSIIAHGYAGPRFFPSGGFR